jgi:hypothetical protein
MISLRSHLKNVISTTTFAVGILAILLLPSLDVCSQTAQPEQRSASTLTSEQLLHSAKIYFRDTTEFPLVQTTTVSVADSSGRIHRTKPYSRTTTFQRYRVKTEKQDILGQTDANFSSRAYKAGPDPRVPISQKERARENNEDQLQPSSQSEWKLNVHIDAPFWEKPWISKMWKISSNSAMWTWVPGAIFTVLAYEPAKYVLNTMPAADQPGSIMAKLAPAKTCPPFTMKDQPIPYFPDGFCGLAEFQLDADLSFQKFAFEAPGLPISAKVDGLGQCILQRYHTVIEFQKVTLPGSGDPFLVPKQVMTTLETSKGNIVIASVYEPQQPKK